MKQHDLIAKQRRTHDSQSSVKRTFAGTFDAHTCRRETPQVQEQDPKKK